ncbi:hypothetical protein HK096_011047, partial [Nowakowskiella sp. JEL0078]
MERSNASFSTPVPSSFVVTERFYAQQFAGFYFTRLAILRKRVLIAAKTKFRSLLLPEDSDMDVDGNSLTDAIPYVERILDVLPGVMCFIMGTVYMDMALKPNILDEIALEEWVLPPPPRAKYISDTDMICLEDESGRLRLVGDILKNIILPT